MGSPPMTATITQPGEPDTLGASARTPRHERPMHEERPSSGPRTAPVLQRRAHPSKTARKVALLSSVAATLGVGVALAHADRSSISGVTTVPSAAGSASSTAGSSVATTTGTGSVYADGTYTGALTEMRYGPVQVRVTIQNGKITAVQEIQSPTDHKSVAINTAAQPILESEAVAAQSAHINAVSGATYTSVAYESSLQAALDQAAAQPATSATATG